MERVKKNIKRVFFPPLWIIFILIPLSAGLLVTAFITPLKDSPICYGIYVLSAYAIAVLCIYFGMVFPQRYNEAKQKIYENPIGNRYMTDAVFKVQISLFATLAINMIYIGINLFSGIYYGSVWFIILAVYYVLLSLIRFTLLNHINHIKQTDIISEYKRYRWCGIILLVITLTLSGIMVLVIKNSGGYEYNGILIYVMAAYTFYIFILAIVNMMKYRKYNSPVLSASKVVNFVAALMSMLSLEIAMLSQFGTENNTPYFDEIMLGSTGAVICVTVVVMAIFMIRKSTKEINKVQIKQNQLINT